MSDSGGWTALMLAAKNGHTDCTRLLVEKEAPTEPQKKPTKKPASKKFITSLKALITPATLSKQQESELNEKTTHKDITEFLTRLSNSEADEIVKEVMRKLLNETITKTYLTAKDKLRRTDLTEIDNNVQEGQIRVFKEKVGLIISLSQMKMDDHSDLKKCCEEFLASFKSSSDVLTETHTQKKPAQESDSRKKAHKDTILETVNSLSEILPTETSVPSKEELENNISAFSLKISELKSEYTKAYSTELHEKEALKFIKNGDKNRKNVCSEYLLFSNRILVANTLLSLSDEDVKNALARVYTFITYFRNELYYSNIKAFAVIYCACRNLTEFSTPNHPQKGDGS